jgi:hypothetical protein
MNKEMQGFAKGFLLSAILLFVSMVCTGCLWRFIVGRASIEPRGESVELVETSIVTRTNISTCGVSPIGAIVECTYADESTETTSRAQMIAEQTFIGDIFDPLVLELPAGVTGIAGTFTDGGSNSGALLVYPNLSFVPVDDNRTLTAGPGRQLVVVDFPGGLPAGVEYELSLSYQHLVPAGTGPTPIRAMMTAKLRSGPKTYYPPMLPCTSDISSLPMITLPRSATLQPIALPEGFEGCDDEPYRFLRFSSSCDLDNDHDVDRTDVDLVLAMRNHRADPGDPRDQDASGRIDANDARRCAVRCSRPRCA